VPDAPINLANDALTTTAAVIRFTWTEGASNGGRPVSSYSVYYDQGIGSYNLLEVGVTTASYTTSVALSADTVYGFTVTATNSVGESL
jgi:hypothetical protein